MTEPDVSAVVNLAVAAERSGVEVEQLWDYLVFKEPTDEVIALAKQMCSMLAGMRQEIREYADEQGIARDRADAAFNRVVVDALGVRSWMH